MACGLAGKEDTDEPIKKANSTKRGNACDSGDCAAVCSNVDCFCQAPSCDSLAEKRANSAKSGSACDSGDCAADCSNVECCCQAPSCDPLVEKRANSTKNGSACDSGDWAADCSSVGCFCQAPSCDPLVEKRANSAKSGNACDSGDCAADCSNVDCFCQAPSCDSLVEKRANSTNNGSACDSGDWAADCSSVEEGDSAKSGSACDSGDCAADCSNVDCFCQSPPCDSLVEKRANSTKSGSACDSGDNADCSNADCFCQAPSRDPLVEKRANSTKSGSACDSGDCAADCSNVDCFCQAPSRDPLAEKRANRAKNGSACDSGDCAADCSNAGCFCQSPQKGSTRFRSDGSAVACGWNSVGQCALPALPAGLTYTTHLLPAMLPQASLDGDTIRFITFGGAEHSRSWAGPDARLADIYEHLRWPTTARADWGPEPGGWTAVLPGGQLLSSVSAEQAVADALELSRAVLVIFRISSGVLRFLQGVFLVLDRFLRIPALTGFPRVPYRQTASESCPFSESASGHDLVMFKGVAAESARECEQAQPPPPPDTLSFQVVVVGGRASGKTAILEAMLQETAALGGAPEEDAGGMRTICHVACEYRGQPFAPSLLELPSDARHAAALPYFCAAAACVVVSVNLADSGCVKDFEDFSDRLGALGGPPSCGLVVANCAGGAPMGAPEWERLAALRETSQIECHCRCCTSSPCSSSRAVASCRPRAGWCCATRRSARTRRSAPARPRGLPPRDRGLRRTWRAAEGEHRRAAPSPRWLPPSTARSRLGGRR
ncbi:unnamed protein product [Prorocentrum cordatum]|uniref:Uncharacterized protein n=1 Tax=Prorocentrum cordatum TaxID=2364126 RepID=A0ABN9PBN7_9DINO|nr:unnamed protein product [Polarella glacialis]